MNSRNFLVAAVTVAACQFTGAAEAQDTYPSRPVRVIVPFVPGSAPDVFARVVGDKWAALVGKAMIVENKPGATSIIGTEVVARSRADGYTLLVATPSTTIMAASGRQLAFNPVKDLTPVSMGISMSPLLITGGKSQLKDLKTVISMAKSSPGKLTIASGGIGNSQHLAAELLMQMGGIQMLHVPYPGTPAIIPALLSGDVDLTFSDASAIPQIKSGKVHAIAVGSPQRSKALPDVPTVAEAGLPGFNYQSWYGFMAPAGTPPATIAFLNRTINQALNDPTVKARLSEAGMEATPSTAEAMGTFMADETKRWTKVIQTANIKFE